MRTSRILWIALTFAVAMLFPRPSHAGCIETWDRCMSIAELNYWLCNLQCDGAVDPGCEYGCEAMLDADQMMCDIDLWSCDDGSHGDNRCEPGYSTTCAVQCPSGYWSSIACLSDEAAQCPCDGPPPTPYCHRC